MKVEIRISHETVHWGWKMPIHSVVVTDIPILGEEDSDIFPVLTGYPFLVEAETVAEALTHYINTFPGALQERLYRAANPGIMQLTERDVEKERRSGVRQEFDDESLN